MTQETTTEKNDVCPECKGKRIILDYARGEMVCQDCGLVLDTSFIDPGPEWRVYNIEDDTKKSRVGAPMAYNVHDKGLSTDISWNNVDALGKPIPVANRSQMYRLRRWQKRVRISNAAERNLAIALAEIERVSSLMGLPKNIREHAVSIYRKAVSKNLIRGRSIESVVAATIYAACRICDVPRTLNEVVDASGVKRKDLGRTYRYIVRTLKIQISPTKPQDYVQRFCSELGLSSNVQKRTVEILVDAGRQDITSGKGPTGVAAAAIYIMSVMCDERRTQTQVAAVAGVTEITIRNRYKEMTEKLGIDIML